MCINNMKGHFHCIMTHKADTNIVGNRNDRQWKDRKQRIWNYVEEVDWPLW